MTFKTSFPQHQQRIYCVSAIYSANNLSANAVVVDGGSITWIGDRRVAQHLFPTAELLDYPHSWISPGLVDSHSLLPIAQDTISTTDHIASVLAYYAARGIVSVHSRYPSDVSANPFIPLSEWIEYQHPISRYVYLDYDASYDSGYDSGYGASHDALDGNHFAGKIPEIPVPQYSDSGHIRGFHVVISEQNSIAMQHNNTDLAILLEKFTHHGIALSATLTGTMGIDRYITAITAVGNSYRVADIASIGHRIELGCWITQQQAEKLAYYGIGVCVLPEVIKTHTPADVDQTHAQLNYLSRSGVVLGIGSRCDAEHCAPWSLVNSLIEPPFSLSSRAAMNAATKGGQRLIDSGTYSGVITVGAPATFVVWDLEHDIDSTQTPHQLARWSANPYSGVNPLPDFTHIVPTAVHTVIDGEIVHNVL